MAMAWKCNLINCKCEPVQQEELFEEVRKAALDMNPRFWFEAPAWHLTGAYANYLWEMGRLGDGAAAAATAETSVWFALVISLDELLIPKHIRKRTTKWLRVCGSDCSYARATQLCLISNDKLVIRHIVVLIWIVILICLPSAHILSIEKDKKNYYSSWGRLSLSFLPQFSLLAFYEPLRS